MISMSDLKKFDIFKDLNDAEADIIREKSKIEIFEEGKRIFAEKSLASKLFLVLDGKVEIKVTVPGGDEALTVDTVTSGGIFGWSSVTDPFTFTAAAWTKEPSKFVTINGEVLLNLFKINNQLGYKVMKQIAMVISKRLRNLNLKLGKCMAQKP